MEPPKIKNHTSHLIEHVDEDGVVTTFYENKHKILIDKAKFSLIYAYLWDKVTESNLSKSDIDLLGYLINHYGNGTTFMITNGIRTKLAEKSGKTVNAYLKSTKALLDTNFIFRVGDSKREYRVNPVYAFQGSSNNRKKAIIEMVEINPDALNDMK